MPGGSHQFVDVILESVGSDPIRLVQALTAAVGLDPMTAMGLMGRAPVPIAQGVDMASGDAMAEQLRAAGAVVRVGSNGLGLTVAGGDTTREGASPKGLAQPPFGGTARETPGPQAGAQPGAGALGEVAAGAVPGGAIGLAGGGGFQRSSLLPALAGQYHREDDLPAGGEADVLLVSDDAGLRWVVKQFRQPGWASDEQVLDRLVAARSGHSRESWAADERTRSLLWVDRWGVDPASGLFYEVAEYVPGGSLTRLDAWPLPVLIDSLVEATASFHETVGAHRDIKPANVLVRDAGRPVLVLADVGLARALDGSKRFSKRDGSAAYQAPEAAQGLVSRAGDWWAVGMVVAQAALGYHPLALPNGSLPPDQVLWTELAQRDVPHLDQIRDERVQLLVRGLLTRDAASRWGLEQVRAWARGESPATGHRGSQSGLGAGPVATAPAARVRPVWFNGQDLRDPAALAVEFAGNTRLAGQMLFQQRDGLLLEDLRLMLGAHGLFEAQTVIDRYKSGAWEPYFLRLLSEMDPRMAPKLDGQDMTPAALYARCLQAIEAGACPHSLKAALGWVIEHDLWRVWRGLPGMGRSAVASEALRAFLADWATDQVSGSVGAGQWRLLLLAPDGACGWWNGTQPGHIQLLDEASTRAFWDSKGGRKMVRVWITLAGAWSGMAPDPGMEDAPSAEYSSFHGQHPNEHDLGDPIIAVERGNLRDQAWWQQLVVHGSTAAKVASIVSIPLAKIAQSEFERIAAEKQAGIDARRLLAEQEAAAERDREAVAQRALEAKVGPLFSKLKAEQAKKGLRRNLAAIRELEEKLHRAGARSNDPRW